VKALVHALDEFVEMLPVTADAPGFGFLVEQVKHHGLACANTTKDVEAPRGSRTLKGYGCILVLKQGFLNLHEPREALNLVSVWKETIHLRLVVVCCLKGKASGSSES
jgi:hypothetical protein